MELFRRLRLSANTASVEQPPTDVFAALIDDLYAPLASFMIGAAASAAVCGVTAWRTGNAWLTVLAVSMVAIATARAAVTLDYRTHKPTIAGDAAALRRWERWYAIGASVYAACLGGACFVVFAFTDDPVSHLLLNATSVGYTAGVTARNSSRPRIAVAQLSLILLPITIGSALRRDTAYAVLSVVTLLYYLATIEIVQFLARHRLRLLLTTREKGELAHSLAEQNFRFDTALANMSHGLCMFDAQRRLLVWNKRFCEIYGIAAEVLSPGLTVRQMIELSAARGNHPDRTVAEMVAEIDAWLASGIVSHLKRPLPDGRIIALSHQPMPDGGVVVIFEDVTEREQAEARAQFLATHDELTGLPNRLVFGQAVSDAVKAGRRYGQEFAVMFVDLDRFKIINDTLGHAAGDSLLTEIANRLRQCVRESDVVARVGGDEFIILLREVSDANQVTTVARKILSTVVKPLTIHGQECRVTASIGISLFPSDAQDEETLVKNADAAMYAAKQEGRNDFRFHSRGDQDSVDRAADARNQPAAGARAQRAVALLPAQARSRPRRHLRGRGSAALAASRSRSVAAQSLHPARRGDRPDRADRQMGA